jgi:hypothetical protein
MVKSAGLVPPRLSPLTVSAALPVLVRVTVWLAPVVPVRRVPNPRLAGLSAAAGAPVLTTTVTVWDGSWLPAWSTAA